MAKGITRRQFLRSGILASASLAALGSGARAWAHDSDFVPAIVIGSGFGGAVAALRLGRAGISTLVLERGRRWNIRRDGNTFATFENPDGRGVWLDDHTGEAALGLPQLVKPVERYAGVLELIAANGIAVGAGVGVGGGSLVFNALIVQPRRRMFERVFPRQIDYDEMDSVYYPRVKSIIRAAPIPNDILNTDYYRSTRVSLQQAQNAGFPTRRIDLAIDWDVVRDEIRGAKVPSAIAGQAWYGLNSGAKRSLDRNYLALAEATRRVEILPLHIAARIEKIRHSNLYAVTTIHINDDGDVVGAPRRFTCKYLFLAAGSMGTSQLLVRAQATAALPALNNQVGRHWASNGDMLVVRAALPSTMPGTGGPGGHFIMEDLNNTFGPTSLVEIVTPPHIAAALSLSGAPGDFASYAGLGIPPALGSFSHDAATDEVHLNWPAGDPRLGDFLNASQQTLATLDQRNGSLTLIANPLVTAHPLGGAVMGKACDFDGRVKNHHGLYVMDGALIEGATGLANPSFTIAALAERCMERILERDRLNNSSEKSN